MNYGEMLVSMLGAQVLQAVGIPWFIPLAVILAIAGIVMVFRPEKVHAAISTWGEQIKAKAAADLVAMQKKCPDGRDPAHCGACNNLPDYEHEHHDRE